MRPRGSLKRAGFRALVAFSAAGSISACAEAQLGAQAVKSVVRASTADSPEPAAADPTLAPEAFEATGLTIWDGAATLEGVWFAHPLASRSQRVRVYNQETGRSVQGALFRRDPTIAGPSILVSSDAARGLGLQPNDPTEVRIIALSDGKLATGPAADAGQNATETGSQPDDSAIKAQALAPPETAAAPDEDAAETTAPRPEPAASTTLKPGTYVQVGSFGSEVNAARLVERLKDRAQPARYVKRSINGEMYSIVVIGPLPAPDAVESAMTAARGEGINDAVRVTL